MFELGGAILLHFYGGDQIYGHSGARDIEYGCGKRCGKGQNLMEDLRGWTISDISNRLVL